MDEKVTFSLDNKSQLFGSNKYTKEKPEPCPWPGRDNNKTLLTAKEKEWTLEVDNSRKAKASRTMKKTVIWLPGCIAVKMQSIERNGNWQYYLHKNHNCCNGA